MCGCWLHPDDTSTNGDPTGGSPEIVEETGLGKVIEYKNYQALIEYAAFVDKNAFEPPIELLRRFSKEKMVENYLQLFLGKND